MSYIEGSSIELYTSKAFTSISGAIVDPDIVTFAWAIQGQTTVTYTYTNGNSPPDPLYKIVRDGPGLYHVDIPTAGYAGTMTWQWSGQPSSGLDTTATSVVYDGETVISPAAL